MTETTEVYRSTARVVFRKAVSDGNYGTEAAEVLIDVRLEDGADNEYSEESIAAALATARRLVHDELATSPSAAVKRALEYARPPTPIGTAANGADGVDAEDLPF